ALRRVPSGTKAAPNTGTGSGAVPGPVSPRMEELFFQSALADSSLALPGLPAQSTPRCPGQRSQRVQQQVRLTLARRSRKTTVPNGNARAHSASPSRRVEVSPPTSPEFPRGRFSYSTFRYGTHTHPGPTFRVGALLDHSFGSNSNHHYAFSEAPRVTRSPLSMVHFERSHRKSLIQEAAPKAAFQQSMKIGARQSYRQTAEEERGGGMMLSVAQPVDGLARLARVRKDGQEVRRMMSHATSVVSMEVDTGRQQEVEPPVHTYFGAPGASPPEMTLERAMSLLSLDDEDTLVRAACHIQNQCLKSADAKKIVYYLSGIEKLLQLLCSDNEVVQRFAAGALRNAVYQSNENKMEVQEKDGLATILQALKSSRDVETRRELTGLLWNLSSNDLLKERLSREALSVLTKSVLVPSSGMSEGDNPKDELLADAAVFHNATGCLRNLSSAGPDGRKAMRECENLIDSLVYYVRGAVADHKTDDKSTENCVCILHNLSYHIAAELPQKYARVLRESRQIWETELSEPPDFFFSPQQQLERQCPLLEDNANPQGIEWLWSAITFRMYLSLMARSVRHCTQEAAVGALQNITAGIGAMSEAITFTVAQRENGLQHVKKMLEEGESDVKRMAVSLIRNLSRYWELHPDIVKQVLPEVVTMLPNDDTGTDLPTEVTAHLCHILNNLSQSNRQHVRAIVNEGALPKIINISSQDNGYGPTRAGQAACVLLHTMWKHSDLHGVYNKVGSYGKTCFVSVRTSHCQRDQLWGFCLLGGNLAELSFVFVYF
uniref:Plakophilin 2 n=1 Tax=Mola mola TaxID=94237 RepID=A0A3Q3VML0_MOLML